MGSISQPPATTSSYTTYPILIIKNGENCTTLPSTQIPCYLDIYQLVGNYGKRFKLFTARRVT